MIETATGTAAVQQRGANADAPATPDEVQALVERTKALIGSPDLEDARRSEDVEESELLDVATTALATPDPEILKSYRAAVAAKDEYEPPRLYDYLKALVTPKSLALIGVLGVLVLAFWLPSAASVGAGVILGAAVTMWKAFTEAFIAPVVQKAGLMYQRAEEDLSQHLRAFLLGPAMRRAAHPAFTDPGEDVVGIGEAPTLAARVNAAARVETRSARRVLVHLKREGGSTVGLAGPRGAGKTDLVRWFCEERDPPSLEAGGTIGIVVPAPVAYEAQPFLRMIIRRLCERVPGYDDGRVSRPAHVPARRLWILGAVAAVFGGVLLLADVSTEIERAQVGTWLIVGGALALLLALLRRIRWRGWSYDYVRSLFARSGDLLAKAARANRRYRTGLARDAEETARRVRFTETRSEGGESALKVRGLEGKLVSSTSWSRLPLTEGDLIAELERLAGALTAGGYDVVIGIDELDKLGTDDAAERFLNSIKVLFPIRDCSFLVTISESAWTRFARRGVPVRDAFDSSLDTVVLVEPLRFAEARSFVRRRGERMSDTEILFCHCLSGGLPRDLLRFGRRLGEATTEAGKREESAETVHLRDVIPTVLAGEVQAKADAVVLAARARGDAIDAGPLVAECEWMRDGPFMAWQDLLKAFISADRDFAVTTARAAFQGRFTPRRSSNADDDEVWVARRRRELYTYLNFLDAVRAAFETEGPIARLADDDHLLDAFEELAESRRRIEIDLAAGWRRLGVARRALGLSELDPHRRRPPKVN